MTRLELIATIHDGLVTNISPFRHCDAVTYSIKAYPKLQILESRDTILAVYSITTNTVLVVSYVDSQTAKTVQKYIYDCNPNGIYFLYERADNCYCIYHGKKYYASTKEFQEFLTDKGYAPLISTIFDYGSCGVS